MSAGYAIDPIRGPADAARRQAEAVWEQAGHAPLPPIPAPVVGWRLTLSLDGRSVEQREHRAFDDAQREGAAWLQQHGSDGISQWMASAAQASRRMGWDHDYRHAISMRGF
ncbi:MAG: hypothetical protein QM761_03420 [Pseudoxanthomonas sp.]